MKTFVALATILLLTCIIVFVGITAYRRLTEPKENTGGISNGVSTVTKKPITKDGLFKVYVNNEFVQSFSELNEALAFAKEQTRAHIISDEKVSWLWDNYPPYHVFTTQSKDAYYEFETYAEAVNFAKTDDTSFVYYRKDNSLIWSNTKPLPTQHIIKNVPVQYQLPQLPRGCEVTSLAMLLNYLGNSVSKTNLAEEIAKDKTPYTIKNGMIYAGDPNQGFVGDMYNFGRFGYGVYHKPIHQLLTKYKPYSSIDMTGCEFEDLLHNVYANLPVWVIINTEYAPLPETEFSTWNLPDGTQIQTTTKEHSVLITGYDPDYVYFNDPLGKADKALKSNFIAAWEQMGRQAVSVSGRYYV